ncbi:phosphoribosyltransferase [Streptomyces spiramenti]|uniref:Phosphoribosyltransferase n=1 Tax=Streptomyces spiramenti TaxID=2720606 RepID=A0ABX1AUN7_9ACTN|nr:phosphoribosyltransferase [Streptomyces spiramenti]NJP68117.1 phosphoribosyltransferase [Streptomyces spiramenti]
MSDRNEHRTTDGEPATPKPETGPGADWDGNWVARRLGVTLHGGELPALVGLALRENPRRAHLLVSRVLGKHIPQRPHLVHGTGVELGRRARALLGAEAEHAVVLGYAETATGLGHSVADGLGARCLHSTRRAVTGAHHAGGFEEEHSHATSHLLLPEDPRLLVGGGPLVLVDDELSTGRTVRNTVMALHRTAPRSRYVVVTLCDLRSAEDVAALEKTAADLGTRIDVVALGSGTVALPEDVLARGRALVAEQHAADAAGPPPGPWRAEVRRVDPGWPTGLPDGGRHGFTPAHRARLEAALPAIGARLAAGLPPGARRVLVLGTEELMYAPLRLAGALDTALRDGEAAPPDAATGGHGVHFSSTTRSPVLPVDDPGYAIRSRLTFPAHDLPAGGPTADDPGVRHVHNVAGGGWDAVVLITDSTGDTPALHAPGGLLDVLSRHAPALRLVVLPSHTPLPAPLRGPAFSSYRPDEVGWLLQDLSDVALEAPTEEREEAIQQGGAHYAESLPVEYQPGEEYQRLFHTALAANADRLAQAVATVTDTVLAERTRPGSGTTPVLVSLARAGTPVGVLMRRWAAYAHGVDLPHYTLSIVRGRGIDTTALRRLAVDHDPADVVFVDGWTGKGAITGELTAALAGFPGFDPSLVVLADPGGCVRTFGTRDDFLVPSACLNSTVSGLVSRTVLRADLVGPDQYHGAKFYQELAEADVSALFLDTVERRFAAARPGPVADGTDREPHWAGLAAVRRLSEEYGIHDVNLVKPGVGETTRVLLRRVPWRVIARRDAGEDIAHILHLARAREVPVEWTDDLPYRCVGLIHPRYTRGATGADGRSTA